MANKYISDLTATTSVAGTDEFELDNGTNSRKITGTNLAKGLRSLGYRGALVKKSADQTGANYTAGVAITWNTEDHDTDAFHDNSTNPEEFTIPSGVSKVRFSCAVSLVNVTVDQWVLLFAQKSTGGGAYTSSFTGSARTSVEIGLGTPLLFVSSANLSVVSGDKFKMMLQVESDTSVDIAAATSWFQIEVIE